MNRCFHMGHSDAPNELLPSLSAEIECHITELGVTEFLVGSHGRFDTLAAKALAGAKKRHPQVALTLLLPYHPGERAVKLPDGFDGSTPRQEKLPRCGVFLFAKLCEIGNQRRVFIQGFRRTGCGRAI